MQWKSHKTSKSKRFYKARLTTVAGNIMLRGKDHNHTWHVATVEVIKINEIIKMDAETTLLPPHVVVSQHLETASQNGTVLALTKIRQAKRGTRYLKHTICDTEIGIQTTSPTEKSCRYCFPREDVDDCKKGQLLIARYWYQ